MKAEYFSVKKNNIVLGLIISMVMTLIVSVPRSMVLNSRDANSISGVALYSFIFSLVIWFAHLYLINSATFSNRIKNSLWRGFISILLVAVVSYFFCDRFLAGIFRNLYQLDELQQMDKHPGLLFARNIFRGIIYYYILFYQKVTEDKKNDEIEIQRLKQLQLEAKIASLKEQLSPHFLFNTLNTLSTLTKEKEAQQLITELANVYRYVLQYKNKEVVELRQELEFIGSYWYILEMRFGDSINLSIKIADDLLHSFIPPLTLQLLLENAVKHNITGVQRPLIVTVYSDGQKLFVDNTYQPRTSEMPSTGEGLNNIAQQYRLLFRQEIEINQGAETFRVSLPVIKEYHSPSNNQ
jgi:two-component system, LytTR family, sensor kinase